MGIAETLTPRRLRWIGAIGLALVLVFVGYGVGLWTSSSDARPGESSAEVGFLRDMSEHHAQAVEMGMIAYRRATLAEVSTLGGDIALTQQAQIGTMQQVLRSWGRGPTGDQPPMAWMPDGSRSLNGNLMPGMANSEEMAKLRAARGEDVDILFCQYMLRHHLGGVHMANGVLAQTSDPDVRRLAEGMKRAQTAEVAALTGLLDKLGAKPL
jgi:uncharacterized protein (DUF305 family)